MENMDKKECSGACEGGKCGSSCGCGSCGSSMGYMHGCHGGKHHLVRIILKIVITVLIFWFGFQLGQMTGFIKGGYGGRGMMGGGFNNYGWGMMRGYNYSGQSAPNLNSSTTTPAPVK